MVLQANFAKRTDAENTPPPTYPKGLASRIQSSIHETSHRRRARNNGASHTSKYAIEQAKRRNTSKSKIAAREVRFSGFTLTPVPTPSDVEMDDATRASTSHLPAAICVPMSFPRTLGRPEFREVSPEALQAIDPSLVDTDINHIRETLEELGPDLIASVTSVRAHPHKDRLPKELEIVINDMTAIPPTHMLAVFGKQSKANQPRKVTLYPVHSLVFASQCASLPKFPTALPVAFPEDGEETRKVTVPVWPVCIPSPATYPHLSTYLYNKSTDFFIRTVLSRPPPPTFGQDPSQIPLFAKELAETFTVQTLVKQTLLVFGVWQNVCALGIFDDNLWETLDNLWELLLTSIAIATGNPSALTTPSPQPSTEEQVSTSTPA
ncbi:clampless1 Clp1 protein [Phlegmacium glaucopus]|nr:clampless1 Clp1 protein [Phlegmacium glaucopus]